MSESEAAPLGAALVLLFLLEVPWLMPDEAEPDEADAGGVPGAPALPPFAGAAPAAGLGAAIALLPLDALPALDPADESEFDAAAPLPDFFLPDFFVIAFASADPVPPVAVLPAAGVLASAAADFLLLFDFELAVESAIEPEAPADADPAAPVESADFFFDFVLVVDVADPLAELSAALASAFLDFFDFLVVVVDVP